MKARLNNFIKNITFTPKPLPVGNYQATISLENESTYRLHLRIENDGVGVLILNASTILHLNPTATEFAYHLIKQTSEEVVVGEFMKRYKVSNEVASQDFRDFKERLESLVLTPDLDPETFLNIDRVDRHQTMHSAPLRLDCAVTYQVSEGNSAMYTPTENVKRELDSEEWKSIQGKAWNSGIPHVVFTGGEPTLRPDLDELIKYSEELGQVTGLITDGLRLTNNSYRESLLQAGLDHLMIVLDPDSNQSWEAIKDCMSEDIFVTVHISFNKKSIQKSTDLFNRLQKLDVKSLSLSSVSKDLKEQLAVVFRKAIEMGFSLVSDLPVPYSAFNPVSLEFEDQENIRSGGGISWLYVEPDGDVLPSQGAKPVLGNILTDPWEKIWAEAKIVAHV
jgi:organic radical activating enzyme